MASRPGGMGSRSLSPALTTPATVALYLQRLPSKDRHRAAGVCKGWREAALRLCRWAITVSLTEEQAEQQLRRLVAGWRGRKLTALILTSGPAPFNLKHCAPFPLSLAGLGRLRSLVRLNLTADISLDLASLSACVRLTQLRVAVPRLRKYKYQPWAAHMDYDHEHDFPIYASEASHDATVAAGLYTLALASSFYLGHGLAPLAALRDLDVSQATTTLGYVKEEGMALPIDGTLPWLAQLTQLTRLKAHAACMTDQVWALPLHKLHVDGIVYREQKSRDEPPKVSPVDLGALAGVLSPQLTKLTFEKCTLSAQGPPLGGAVRALRLVKCFLTPHLDDVLTQQAGLALTKEDVRVREGPPRRRRGV